MVQIYPGAPFITSPDRKIGAFVLEIKIQDLTVSEIYESYIQWCLSSGLANDKSGISKASFISETDRFISNAAEMSKRLGECFSGLKRGRVKRDGRCVRVIGVMVNALQ